MLQGFSLWLQECQTSEIAVRALTFLFIQDSEYLDVSADITKNSLFIHHIYFVFVRLFRIIWQLYTRFDTDLLESCGPAYSNV